MEPSHKAKVTRTALALGSYLFHGMNNGVLGPSILDIAAITQSSTLQAASCLTWRSIGTLGGLLITGFFYDRYNEHLLLGVTMLVMGTTVAVAPLCTNLTLMYLFLVINGVMQGSATVGHTGLPVKIWGAEKCGPVVQAIHLMSSLGSALIPLILAPFLINSKEIFPRLHQNISHIGKRAILTSTDYVLGNGSTTQDPKELIIKDLLDEKKYPSLHKQFMNILSHFSDYISSAYSSTTSSVLTTKGSTVDPTTASTVSLAKTTSHITLADGSTANNLGLNYSHGLSSSVLQTFMYTPRIQYGYAILATGLFVVAIFHFLFAMRKGANYAKKKQHGVLVSVMPPWIVLFIFFWLGYFNGAIETVYGEVIQPFLDKHLEWSAKTAAFLISIFWFGQGAGRTVGIPIAKFVTPDKMLFGNTLVVIVAGAAMVFFINNSVMVWICIILIAIGLSTERGCEVSWLVLLIPFRGMNNGILFCGIYAGKGLTPVIYGVLSRYFGQMVLMYMGVVMSITMAMVVVICFACVQYQTTKTAAQVDHDEIEKMLYSNDINENGKLPTAKVRVF